MDTIHARRFLCGKGPQALRRPTATQEARASERSFPHAPQLRKIRLLSPLHGAAKCAHGITLFFWKGQRLICAIAVLRAAKQGDFSTEEMKLLRQLYPQFLAALRGIESLERERCVRADFEEVLQGLPLPTIILRWNLRPIYQNKAAREFCAVWEKGPEEAKRTKASSPIPVEILDRCRVLKQEWVDARPSNAFGAMHGFQGRTDASSAIPAFARDDSTQANQFRRRGGTTFSHRLRRSVPKRNALVH
jgi:hypothetical protein